MAKKEAAKKETAKKEAVKKEITNNKEDAESQAASSTFNAGTFLQETKEELEKVSWPSRQQLISESVAVLLMVVLSTTLIYLVDNFFSWAARQVFG